MPLSCYIPSQIISESRVVHLADKQILKRHILSYPKFIVSKTPPPHPPGGWGAGLRGWGGGSIPGPWTNLDVFFDHINSFHPTIKFTIASSTDQLPFLDILISLKDGLLKTDIHSKPTDSHAYLPNSFCCPRHVVKNIPYSQFLRLRRFCADTEVFNARCDEMEGRFLRRGHHLKNVQEARTRASNTPRSETLQHKPSQSTNRTPFIVTHHPSSQSTNRTPFDVTHHPSNPPLRSWFTELQPSVLHTSRRMQQAPSALPSLGSATVSRCVHSSCRPSCPPRRTQTLAASDATSVHVSYAPATWWKPGVSLSAALLHGSTTTSVQPKGNCDVLRELRIAPNWLFTGIFLWSSATPWRRFTEPPDVTICATRYVTARPLDSCTASPMSSWEERRSRSCPPTFLSWTYPTRSPISCMKRLQTFSECSTHVLFQHLLNHLRVPGCVLSHLFLRIW